MIHFASKQMRRISFLALLLALAFLPNTSEAQAPQGIQYQSVFRDASGNLLASKSVAVRFKITDASGSTTYWQEDQTATTNAYGLVNLVIGQGTKSGGTAATFSAINWSASNAKIEVLADLSGGTNYVAMGNNNLWSVPYALSAPTPSLNLKDLKDISSNAATNGMALKWNGTQWAPAVDEKGATTLDELTDVTSSSATNGMALKWNGSQWAPAIDEKGANNIDELGDVNSSGATPGQVLKWDGTSWKPSVDNIGSTGSFNLKDLTDVNAPSPASGQILRWNGVQWAPAADGGATKMSELSDVSSSAPTSGYVLKWNGTQWIPQVDSKGAEKMEDLTNVDAAGATNGQILKYNGTTWKLVNDDKGAEKLDDLSDVAIAITPTTGQVLKFNGTTWAPGTDAGATDWTKTSSNHLYYTTGRVGINTSTPTSRLHVKETLSSTTLDAALLESSGGSGSTTNFATLNVLASNSGFSSNGITSRSTGSNTVGRNRGFNGFASGSNNNQGVLGYGSGRTTTGTNYGVIGVSDSSTNVNIGVQGEAASITTATFRTIGSVGIASGSSTNSTANSGGAILSYNTGMLGQAEGHTFNNYGVYGLSIGSISGSTGARNVGVIGEGQGNSVYNYGLLGVSQGTGAQNFGMAAVASGTNSTFNIGVFGNALNGGTNYAGYFNGLTRVTTDMLVDNDAEVGGDLDVVGFLTKGAGTFKIDHPQDPENKFLIHSFVESPEMMNVYNGNITTGSDSTAVVSLPAYFQTLNKDFRYQLTVIGTFAQAIVLTEVSDNQFVIKTNQANVKVSWQVTGVRQDPYANANRVVDEVQKVGEEKGKYLHPEVYGKPKEKAIHFNKDAAEINANINTGGKDSSVKREGAPK